jgi:hypothetical protein
MPKQKRKALSRLADRISLKKAQMAADLSKPRGRTPLSKLADRISLAKTASTAKNKRRKLARLRGFIPRPQR